MESEERPTKMRKLEHDAEVEDAPLVDAPTNAVPETKETTPADEQSPADNNTEQSNDTPKGAADGGDAAPKISKNQLKKQRRLEKWEAGREDRKVKRREKLKAKRGRKREEWAQNHPSEDDDATNGTGKAKLQKTQPPKYPEGKQLPITFLFDCDFDDLMFEPELKSLGVQITRSYSDNRKSHFHAHMAVSSFGGKLQERFDGILAKQYTSWKNIQFFSEDFVHVAEKAKGWMQGESGGVIAGALDQGTNSNDTEEGEVVYLTSDSDVILDRLKPNSTYIIGGLVDKNRHKGICYKRAMDRGIKTAKLPIGEFLQMKSRQVLATNHVIEIMLKWMECGDWGKAFMDVIPRRKGGVLKSELEEEAQDDEEVVATGDDLDGDAQDEKSSQVDDGGKGPEDILAASKKPEYEAPPLAKGSAAEPNKSMFPVV
ncbi:hypothetical protein K505DRAFT_325301 [Melanomma pulvis-pyrius CBS 109.77]|uniref:tRNA (guanine(9)-N1)-methyltransferase n=1 Tax=Melanomma pulvis-pyrius CBS 109.77 TaxID=1314802 RepID=A0A6A6XCP8_9PLEO|nr:hypothetical protein K505DRAFT_325301 [Melanomma pulvis-pyrius CBS 109.77]